MDIWAALGQWAEERRKAVIITLIEAPAMQSPQAGLAAIMAGPGVEPSGPLTAAPFWAEDWLAALEPATATLPPAGGQRLETGGRRYLIDRLDYDRSALVLGGGHVGDALARLLRFLDFEVTLMDDRPEFLRDNGPGITALEAPFERLTELFVASAPDAVVIVTRGHAQDSACLRQVLAWPEPPPYLGMIGSRKRTAETLKMLTAEGFPPERLQAVHTPVGLNIGAQTPAEIAVSIAAEIIQELRKRDKEIGAG
ncbi:MAG: XdhC family protein [Candidatus Adiutrix sp.]|jgi:xanthine dehydrogenase accessory factor|nr:XdhC family protein [Candidatus Adiutrix sp.]